MGRFETRDVVAQIKADRSMSPGMKGNLMILAEGAERPGLAVGLWGATV